jgi:hypothetical protein
VVRIKACCAVASVAMIICPVLDGRAQEISPEMDMFRPFLGATWAGHFSDPQNAHFTHVVEWEPVLEGRCVRLTKHVDELSFRMEILYYWDPGEQHVAFLSLTNRGQLSKGVAEQEGGLVVLYGESITKEARTPFKQSFEVREDGVLEDRFYGKPGGEWQERHLIVMKRGDEK